MDDETETELYYAIDKNHPEKIEKLLKNGLDPNVVFNGYDHLGKTWYWAPLHFCCEKGRLGMYAAYKLNIFTTKLL